MHKVALRRAKSAAYRLKLSKASKRLWRTPSFRTKIMKALAGSFGKSPNHLEMEMAKILRNLGIKYQGQKSVCGCLADFVIPKYNIVIECDGAIWHSKPEAKVRDRIKNRKYKQGGYKLLRFSYEQVFYHREQTERRLLRAIEV